MSLTGSGARPSWAVRGLPLLLAVLVTGPLLTGRGFWSFGDMVFVPRQPWKPEWYGAGDAGVPRAVPSDALVSLVTQVVPGDLVQKAVLVGLLAAAGWGVQRLLPGAPWPALVLATVVFVWNPYVLERLAIGHWALLCGYAALPWVVHGALLWADQGSGAWGWLFVPAALAAWTSPTGGVLALVVGAGVLAVAARGRSLVAGLGLLVLVQLPWLVPGLVATGSAPVDPGGAAAFAARTDSPYGLAGSLLTLGGIWKTSVVPDERGSRLAVGLALAVVAVALVGVILSLARGHRRPLLLGVLVGAAPLWAWTLVSATGTGQQVTEWVIIHVPGGGLVRDSQKLLAVPALLVALGAAVAVEAAARWLEARPTRPPAATLGLLALAPVVALPSLAWGNLGEWQRTSYPEEWASVASLVAADERAGTVVLPFGVYRRFEWNDDHAWLDPAPRLLPGRVLVDDTLTLGEGDAVAGESEAAARVREAVASWESLDPVLDDLGIRFALVELGTPGEQPAGAAPAVAYDGTHLRLHDRGPQRELPTRWGWWLLALDAALLATFLVGLARIGMDRLRHGYTARGVSPLSSWEGSS